MMRTRTPLRWNVAVDPGPGIGRRVPLPPVAALTRRTVLLGMLLAVVGCAAVREPQIAAMPEPLPMPMNEPSLPDPSHAKTPEPPRPLVTEAQRQRGYVGYIVRKYRVERALAARIVQASVKAGGKFGLKPTLLLGVIAVESSFDPNAFNGVDMGLMQVNPTFHPEKIARIGGANALYDVDKNVYVGAWVLRQYMNSTRSESGALLRYAGAQRYARDYPVRVANQRAAIERAAGAWSAAGDPDLEGEGEGDDNEDDEVEVAHGSVEGFLAS